MAATSSAAVEVQLIQLLPGVKPQEVECQMKHSDAGLKLEGARLENYLPWILRLLLMSLCIIQVFDTGWNLTDLYHLLVLINSVLVSDSNCLSICFV